jgi:hypothetical protein
VPAICHHVSRTLLRTATTLTWLTTTCVSTCDNPHAGDYGCAVLAGHLETRGRDSVGGIATRTCVFAKPVRRRWTTSVLSCGSQAHKSPESYERTVISQCSTCLMGYLSRSGTDCTANPAIDQ